MLRFSPAKRRASAFNPSSYLCRLSGDDPLVLVTITEELYALLLCAYPRLSHYSLVNLNVRISVKLGKARTLNYLCSMTVDEGHGIISQVQVDFADRRDCSLPPKTLPVQQFLRCCRKSYCRMFIIATIVTIFTIVTIGEMLEITILFSMSYVTTDQGITVHSNALFTREAIVCYLSGAGIFQYFPDAIHRHLTDPVVIVSIEHQYPANPGFRVEKQERYHAGGAVGMPNEAGVAERPRCRICYRGCARYASQTEWRSTRVGTIRCNSRAAALCPCPGRPELVRPSACSSLRRRHRIPYRNMWSGWSRVKAQRGTNKAGITGRMLR